MSQDTTWKSSRDSFKMFVVLLTLVLMALSSSQNHDKGIKQYWYLSLDIHEKVNRGGREWRRNTFESGEQRNRLTAFLWVVQKFMCSVYSMVILLNIQSEIHKILDQRKTMFHFMFRKALHAVKTSGKYSQIFENTIMSDWLLGSVSLSEEYTTDTWYRQIQQDQFRNRELWN